MVRPIRLVDIALYGALGVALGGCNMLSKLAAVGEEPPMTRIQNPIAAPVYWPVTLPMPVSATVGPDTNSLWRPGARAFFKDQRAQRVGDILTVLIEIDDNAKIKNETQRTRENTEDTSANAFLGYESSHDSVLPETINPSNLIDLDSKTQSKGTGAITRDEKIKLRNAATITQVLPNGNLVLHGRQEVRVTFGVRELLIAGVVRTEDITSANTITHDKIAEARIAYGGPGHISDFQQARYGQQVFDIIWPF